MNDLPGFFSRMLSRVRHGGVSVAGQARERVCAVEPVRSVGPVPGLVLEPPMAVPGLKGEGAGVSAPASAGQALLPDCHDEAPLASAHTTASSSPSSSSSSSKAVAGGAAWIAPRLERKVLAFPGCERFAAAVQSAISEEALSRAQALEAAARLGDAGFCAGRDALAQRIAAPARRSLPERPRGAPADLRPLPPYEAATAEDRAGTTTLPCTQEQIVDYIQRRWRGDRCIVLPPGCEGAMMPDFSASGRRGRDSSTDGG